LPNCSYRFFAKHRYRDNATNAGSGTFLHKVTFDLTLGITARNIEIQKDWTSMLDRIMLYRAQRRELLIEDLVEEYLQVMEQQR
jgi:hypothetical protein